METDDTEPGPGLGGTRRGAHDLMIAATALATKRIVLTTDRSASFQDLPGVDFIVVT